MNEGRDRRIDLVAQSVDPPTKVSRAINATVAFDTDDNLVSLKVCGELTADAFITLMNRVGADPRFVAGMHAIADYREAYGTWDYSEIQRVRDYVAQIAVPHQARWAAVLKPGTLAAAGHVLVLINEAVEPRIRIQLFDDLQRAQRWIGESAAPMMSDPPHP